MNDLIYRQTATQITLEFIVEYLGGAFDEDLQKKLMERMNAVPLAQPEIIRCKECKHKPVTNDNYDDEWDCGFNIEFPDYKCPCQCEDGYYNRLPDDNWFCGNAERRTDNGN